MCSLDMFRNFNHFSKACHQKALNLYPETMKYLIFIGLFLAGGALGYFLGVNQEDQVMESTISEEPEKITEFIYDTIVRTETVEVPIEEPEPLDTLKILVDSLQEPTLDTLKEKIKPRDTLESEEDMNIRKDELLATKTYPIIYLNQPVQNDTLVKEMLGIRENQPKEMNVQFWQSPLNYKGYKLSRNTLIVYGLSDQLTYDIYYRDGKFYLSNEGEFYRISETTAFASFQPANRSAILND